MAGNRLQRTGSIFERLTGILKAGAIKEQDKPIWYDVYKAFPPKHDPSYARPPVEKEIKPIFYPEDIIRAKFCKIYGNTVVYNLLTPENKSLTERFLETYQKIEKTGQYKNEDLIFKATEKALENDGIRFLRTKKVDVSAENPIEVTKT